VEERRLILWYPHYCPTNAPSWDSMRKRATKTRARKGKAQRAPTALNGTVPPRRRLNSDVRPREYLTPKEVERLIEAARRRGRYGIRDALMILVTFRHGLRAAEVCALTWDQVDFGHGLLHVRRVKNGMPSVHPMGGGEVRALRALKRDDDAGRFVFMTERRAPMTPAGFRKMIARTGLAAKITFPVHPHMLRHACGYKLANDGQDTRALQHYLGHKNISHTVRYTELSPERFKNFWGD
jgi:site-specific recombinase XerD